MLTGNCKYQLWRWTDQTIILKSGNFWQLLHQDMLNIGQTTQVQVSGLLWWYEFQSILANRWNWQQWSQGTFIQMDKRQLCKHHYVHTEYIGYWLEWESAHYEGKEDRKGALQRVWWVSDNQQEIEEDRDGGQHLKDK